MKVSKDALRTARQFLRLTLRNGNVDEAAAKSIVDKVIADKPRNYLGILTAYQRLLRLELEKRHAIVDSATELGTDEQGKITTDLQSRYGSDVTAEFRTVPELLGGIRIKLGSTVWDGSVKARLETLRSQVLA
ncbi:MAG: H(+)-transporting ATPase [Verrucomicrobiaceae bacterium]|nr:MAG: H(+)-transporting ATPase [Verrucomicrobiaceae bacterium]